MTRFVVYGAGAVGGVIGGQLALSGNDVLLICREEHARAIQDQAGLRMESDAGIELAALRAKSQLTPSDIDPEGCVVVTCKSYDTRRCVDDLGRIADPTVPIICFQNGVANEDIVAKRFDRVYGGVCRMACSFLSAGQVSFHRPGRLILGRYPTGKDPVAQQLGSTLSDARFDVFVSEEIVTDKWLKLAVNLMTGLYAMIDAQDFKSDAFVALKAGLLEEADRVLAAADIKAVSCDPDTPSIRQMIDNLRSGERLRSPSRRLKDKVRAIIDHSHTVHNSTWQTLYRHTREPEDPYFHGPIIELAKERGIPVPFNLTVLDAVLRCHRERTGPNRVRAADLLDAVEETPGV